MSRRKPYSNESMTEETGRAISRQLTAIIALLALIAGKLVIEPALEVWVSR